MSSSFDVQVVGTGIVGHALALSLARLGLRVALRRERGAGGGEGAVAVADDAGRVEDVRAYALNASSVALLAGLKVWDALPAAARTAVHDMQVHGDAGGAALAFSAWQQRVGQLAWITDAAVLERQLAAATRFSPHVTVVDAEAVSGPSTAPLTAPLTALCDGRASPTRDALGVGFERHDYGQRAIAARLDASLEHGNTARQWFGAPDVLALLPFDTPTPSRSYALVWSLPEPRAAELLALPDAAFERALADATGGAAGALTLASARRSWPLSLGLADAWSGPGWALLGDAAHMIHPLAGQGLNLGLGDVAALTRVIEQREPWRALGDARLLRRYARERAAPTWAMQQATDGLWRVFSTATPAVRTLRNRGLGVVDRLTPIKRWLTSQALDA